MRVHPQKLVARLTPTAKRTIEQAVGKAVEAQHSEVTVEHALLAITSESKGDAECLLRALGREPRVLTHELEHKIRRFRNGSVGKPRLSDALARWLSDAWMMSSLEWNETRVRSGALLTMICRDPERYTVEAIDALGGIGSDDLASAREALSLSLEHSEANPTAEGQGGGRPATTSGEATALARFTRSFVEEARAGRIDPIFGRDREIRQVIDVLCRRRKNNPILVGEPGVGKTALVEGLALAIVRGEAPEVLRGTDVRGLDLGLLEAGASVKGEFESRLQSVIREVQASSTPIVLFIDEAHTLIGAGNAKGGADAANLLKPALARGELRTIAATTFAEYKQYFEKDAALERRFQPIKVEEPSEDVAIGMLRGLREAYERTHDVFILDEAIEAAVRLGHRYLTGRQLPDKAVDLLDTTAARVRVDRTAKPQRIVELEAELASLERKEAAMSRDLVHGSDDQMVIEMMALGMEKKALRVERDELLARWHKQRESLTNVLLARKALEEARAHQPKDRIESLEETLRQRQDELRCAIKDVPLISVDVDALAVARTIELWTGIPIGAMQDSTRATSLELSSRLQTRVLGQRAALDRIADGLRVSRAGLRTHEGPLGVFLLVGPSGVGKTETAHAIADELFGGDRFLTTINLSEYQEAHTATRLVGAPPSFVGYGEGGELTEAVRQRPYSVVLLDECEKAALEVMNTFYRVFDKGFLSDSEGRVIDFRNTCILLTSNLASDQVIECAERGMSASEIEDAIRPILSRHFKPALLHRMTVVPYMPIERDTVRGIVALELARIGSRLREVHEASFECSDEAREHLIDRCHASEGGVRHLRRMLEAEVLVPLSTLLLTNSNESGSKVSVQVLDHRLAVTLD